MRAAIWSRVSTHDQQTHELQVEAMTASINGRGWDIVEQVNDVGFGGKRRPGRQCRAGWDDHRGNGRRSRPCRTKVIGTADPASGLMTGSRVSVHNLTQMPAASIATGPQGSDPTSLLESARGQDGPT
jgi:hypothetical protein